MDKFTRLQMLQVEECMRVSAEDAAVVMQAPFGPASSSLDLPAGWRYERQVAPGVQTWSSAGPSQLEPPALWPNHAGKGTGSLRKFHARGVILGAAPAHVAHLFAGTEGPGRLSWDHSYTGYELRIPAYPLPSPQEEPAVAKGFRQHSDTVDVALVTIAPILIVSARDFVNLQYMRRFDAAGASGSADTYTPPLLSLHAEPRYSAHPASDLVPGLVPGSILCTSCVLDPNPSPSSAAYVEDRESEEGIVRGEVLPGSKFLLQPLFAGVDEDAPDVQAALHEGKLPLGWSVAGPKGKWTEDPLLTCPYSWRRIIGTRLLFTIYTDPRGWIPHAIVNQAVTDSFARYWNQMREYLATHGVTAGVCVPSGSKYIPPQYWAGKVKNEEEEKAGGSR